jgi:hypothetical protein
MDMRSRLAVNAFAICFADRMPESETPTEDAAYTVI